jgi:hypothetical protein
MDNPLVRAQHYRNQAARLRKIAEDEQHLESKRDLLALAAQYDGLSKELAEKAAKVRSDPG